MTLSCSKLTIEQDKETGLVRIANIDISQHVIRLGGTPCYLYDRACMLARYKKLKQLFGSSALFYYAIKANPMSAIVAALSNEVDGFDVASTKEMNIALNSGAPAESICYSGPGKSTEDLRRALYAGITINVESIREIKTLGTLARASELTPRITIRVNPDMATGHSSMVMGGKASQFGIDESDIGSAIDAALTEKIEISGLHFFIGSQILDPETIKAMHNSCYATAKSIVANYDLCIDFLNLGGGFGIPYYNKDTELDVRLIAENTKLLSDSLSRDFGSNTRIKFELGRYLVAQAGIYITSVIDTKTSKGRAYLVTDGGLNHNLAATGNLGQVLPRNYPLAINGKVGDKKKVSIVGPMCTPLDRLGNEAELPEGTIGDLVIVFCSGAYGLSASPTNFLNLPEAAEALV